MQYIYSQQRYKVIILTKCTRFNSAWILVKIQIIKIIFKVHPVKNRILNCHNETCSSTTTNTRYMLLVYPSYPSNPNALTTISKQSIVTATNKTLKLTCWFGHMLQLWHASWRGWGREIFIMADTAERAATRAMTRVETVKVKTVDTWRWRHEFVWRQWRRGVGGATV